MEYKEEEKRKEFLFDNVSIREAIKLFREDSEACKLKFGNMQFWITTNVTDMGELFKGHTDFDEDISRWDVSNVTNMESMFFNAEAFNQPIGAWNVRNVTNMKHMFASAYIFDQPIGAYAFNQPIGAWNVSNVTNMNEMFANASAFNQPIGAWNVSNVTNMERMFANAYAFNQPIGAWNVSNVTNMESMFDSAKASAFNQPIGAWNVSNVTNMKMMFNRAKAFNQPIGAWNVSNVTNMERMFAYAFAFNQPIGAWNVSNVTNMESMFDSAAAFNQPIGAWNVSNVTNMDMMFYSAAAFNQPIGEWNVSNVTTMKNMFANAWAFNQPIGAWNVSNVTNMEEMFAHASAFNQPIGAWNVSNVTNMKNMFERAYAFNQPIGAWNVSNVTNMEEMFERAYAFNQPIGAWNVSNVTNMKSMFKSAYAFNQPIGAWNVSNVTNMREMFYSAEAFNQPIGAWNLSNVTNMEDMFRDAYAFNQPIGTWNVFKMTQIQNFCDYLFLNHGLFNLLNFKLTGFPRTCGDDDMKRARAAILDHKYILDLSKPEERNIIEKAVKLFHWHFMNRLKSAEGGMKLILQCCRNSDPPLLHLMCEHPEPDWDFIKSLLAFEKKDLQINRSKESPIFAKKYEGRAPALRLDIRRDFDRETYANSEIVSWEFLKYIVTLPLAPIFAQFLILIVLSKGFTYASVNYTFDLSRVFLSFVLSPYFVALVGVFFLKSTEAIDSEAVIAAVLGSTWLCMWLLFWRARQDQNFYTTLCTGAVLRTHSQRIDPSVSTKLNECLKKHTPKWLTLATLVSLLLLLFESYQLSSFAVIPGVYTKDAPVDFLKFAVLDFNITIGEKSYYKSQFGVIVVAVTMWLALSEALLYSLYSRSYKVINSIPLGLGTSLVSVLSTTAYLILLDMLLQWVDCTFDEELGWTLDMMQTTHMICWDEEHLPFGVTALFLIVSYSMSSSVLCPFFMEDADPCVDIRFSESSQLLDRNLKFAVVVASRMMSRAAWLSAALNCVCFMILAYFFHFPLKKPDNYRCSCGNEDCEDALSACSVHIVLYYKKNICLILAFASAVGFVASFADPDQESWTPYITLVAGSITMFLASLLNLLSKYKNQDDNGNNKKLFSIGKCNCEDSIAGILLADVKQAC